MYALYLRQYVFSNYSWYMTPMYRNLSNNLISHLGYQQKHIFSPACSNRLVEAFAWSESMSIPSLPIYPHFPLAFLKAATQKGNWSLTPQRFKMQFQFEGYYITSCLVDRFCLCFCFRSIVQIWVMKFEHVGKHGYLPWNDPAFWWHRRSGSFTPKTL